MEIKSQLGYCIVFCVLGYASFEEAMAAAPDGIAAHVKRSRELHENGTLPLLGAFLDESDEPHGTMAVTTSREAAEEYVKGDPFFLNGKMMEWYTRVGQHVRLKTSSSMFRPFWHLRSCSLRALQPWRVALRRYSCSGWSWCLPGARSGFCDRLCRSWLRAM
jgi:uncharacterized protein YciI